MTTPSDRVPWSLRLAASIAWRALVVALAVAVLAAVLARLRVIVVPVAVALLLATFLVPPARWLRARGWPRALAALAVVFAALSLVGVAALALVPPIASDVGQLDVSVEGGVDQATDWLSETRFGLSDAQVERWKDRAADELRSQSGAIVGGLFGGAYLALELVAGLVLAIVVLFFFVKDGDELWRWAVSLFPGRAREQVDAVGAIAWETAGGYIRGVSVVALADAVFIGLALWLIGVPFVLPLAALTFVGGFFPIVGAFAAGFAAAMVALVAEGWLAALLVVGAAFLVQQLEGNLLQPFIVGSAVKLHPLAILLAITAGAIVWGVAGAFLAVPLVAVTARAAARLAEPG
jgi:putative heme transporter